MIEFPKFGIPPWAKRVSRARLEFECKKGIVSSILKIMRVGVGAIDHHLAIKKNQNGRHKESLYQV